MKDKPSSDLLPNHFLNTIRDLNQRLGDTDIEALGRGLGVQKRTTRKLPMRQLVDVLLALAPGSPLTLQSTSTLIRTYCGISFSK
jgi:hypothetical protein